MNDIVNVMEVKQTQSVTSYPCPVCKVPLLTYNDATGYMVYCDKNNVCSSNEQPFGHGKTVKAAYEVLVEKWDFATKDRGVKNSKVS